VKASLEIFLLDVIRGYSTTEFSYGLDIMPSQLSGYLGDILLVLMYLVTFFIIRPL